MPQRQPRNMGGNAGVSKDRLFTISIKLVPTGEVFPLKKVHSEMKIRELKHLAEYATGIPQHIQRLCYLDEGDLQDNTDVRHNDIIPGAILHMNVWQVWKSLVEAAATNDTDYVFKLGVTQDTEFKTPNSEYMGVQNKTAWIAERAFTALYIACHRGYLKTAQKLINAGANVDGRTGLGQTPLHVAAANGHGTVVDLLLEKGADIDAVDQFGESALAVASRFGHKGCERHLFLFRWQQRAKNIQPHQEHDMFAHQYFDSAFPVWLKGDHAQIYFTQILPPGEFEGTSMMAPRRMHSPAETSTPESYMEDDVFIGDGQTKSPLTQDGLHRAGGMTPIREESSSADSERTSPDPKHRPQGRRRAQGGGTKESFEEWLQKKKTHEQKIIDQKKRDEEARKIAEEDAKRQEDLKDKSYEQWLAEKETPAKPMGKRQVGNAGKPGGSTSGPGGGAMDGGTVSAGDSLPTGGKKRGKAPQTANDVIQTIMRRREEEGDMAGRPNVDVCYEERDGSLMEQIRLGRTPLQKRLQQKIL